MLVEQCRARVARLPGDSSPSKRLATPERTDRSLLLGLDFGAGAPSCGKSRCLLFVPEPAEESNPLFGRESHYGGSRPRGRVAV